MASRFGSGGGFGGGGGGGGGGRGGSRAGPCAYFQVRKVCFVCVFHSIFSIFGSTWYNFLHLGKKNKESHQIEFTRTICFYTCAKYATLVYTINRSIKWLESIICHLPQAAARPSD